MGRHRRHPKIYETDRGRITRHAEQLTQALDAAATHLSTASPHYDAVSTLRSQVRVCVNLIHDRPADYVEPYGNIMQTFFDAEQKAKVPRET